MTRLGILIIPLAFLAACQSPEPMDWVPPKYPIASTVPDATPPNEQEPSLPQASKLNLRFTVQASQSTGHIRTTLNPHGPVLGPQSSECRTPLRGSIHATLVTKPSGHQSLLLGEVDLQTTSESRFHYKWSPLLGSIVTAIPAGVLQISDYHIPGACELDPDGTFHTPGNQFTVACHGNVEGRGLVLGKAVGASQSALNIPVTQPVTMKGSLKQTGDELILHIPGTILRDRFDLPDATLDLLFAGDITATTATP